MQNEPAFGGGMGQDASVKSKLINLINSVRTLMRSERQTVWSIARDTSLTNAQYL